MVRGGHALGLPVLGHDVADVDLQRVGGTHRVGNAVHQQVGDDAGVKAAGAQEDQLRLPDGPHRLRQSLWVLGQQADALNAAVLLLLEGADLRLPQHPGAVLEGGLQRHVLIGHRQHPAADGQHLAHAGHRLVEGVGDAVEGGQDQVAEGLPRQVARALRESVGQKLLHHRLGVGQGLHAVADVPRRGHTQILPQHARAAAVVGHGDDGRQAAGAAFQPPQHGGQPRASSDGHNPGARSAVPFRHSVHLLTPASCPGGSPWPDSLSA